MIAIAIDPPGCGCTECLTGEYIPLDQATPEQVKSMLIGRLRDHTSATFTYSEGVLSENAWGLRWELTS